jgi:hypothetical protein
MQTELFFINLPIGVEDCIQTKHRPSQGGFAFQGTSGPLLLPFTISVPSYTKPLSIHSEHDRDCFFPPTLRNPVSDNDTRT